MESNDIDNIKRYCTHLIRHKLKQDMFLSSILNHFIDIQFVKKVKKQKRFKLF